MLHYMLKRKLTKDQDFDIRNIEAETGSNTDYRRVLFTTDKLQLIVMCLKENEEIGFEQHDNDQFIRIEEGKGIADISGQQHFINAGDSIIIKAGSRHNIGNASSSLLKLYSLYSPPHHKDGLIEKEKT
jgi:mannose-6-phosphate isomerase-like protein (cupin superfamily)